MRNALLSLSNKTRCLELVDFLIGKNCNIIASKGTYNYLYGCVPNTNLKKIDDMIQFPIVLEQRMKCFHPAIFTGLLADTAYTKQNNYLKPHNITTIDITVANLCPFEKMIHGFYGNIEKKDEILLGQIDIGGHGILRAAAKNYKDNIVLCSPTQYSYFMKNHDELLISEDLRRELALETFEYITNHDISISNYFANEQKNRKQKNIKT